jgi:hypothetical protein
MSRKLQFVAALLVIYSLSLGTLSAMPLRHPKVPAEQGSTLNAVVSWAVSLFSVGRPASRHPRPKLTLQIDPNGGH